MLRSIKIAFVILAFAYLVIASYSALTRGRIEQVAAAADLKGGVSLLISDPTQAQKLFKQGGNEAVQGLVYYQKLPWWSRILTPLPPFRYRVELLQSMIELASAGQQAISLESSLPKLVDQSAQSTPQATTYAMNQLFLWYQEHLTDINTLHSTISETNRRLSYLPYISINYSDKQQLLKLEQGFEQGQHIFNTISAHASSQETQTVISFYQDTEKNNAGHMQAANNKITETLFNTASAAPVKTISIVFPFGLVKALLAETGPIIAPGVEAQTVSVESITGISPSTTLNALATYYFSHPEHFNILIRELTNNPPQLLEP